MNSQNPPEQQANHHDEIPHDLPKVSRAAVAIIGLVAVIALIALFAIGWFPHRHRIEEAKKDADSQDDTPVVEVTQPTRKSKGFDLWLPADLRAMQETAIYPRTSGYLKRWLVDVGQHVNAGDLLAEIDTPEVDAQLNQSKATLEQTKANVTKTEADMNLAKVTLQRFLDAQKSSPGSVTPQDVDEKQSAYDDAASAVIQAKAGVVAGEAEVHRLMVMQSFEKIVAPFSGTITVRNYDNGALLSSGNTAVGAELFRVQETDTLRAYVNVPQTYATSLKNGQDGFLSIRNFPGREFKGIVVRSAGTVDPTTRTLRLEIDVPNADGVLLAGMYGQIRLNITPAAPPVIVPTGAVVFDSDGTKVGVVDENKIHYKKVVLGRDFGTEVEVASGLDGDEQVVTNPGIRTLEGIAVHVAPQEAAAPASKPQQPQVSKR